ncbi:MAG: hypothetical protein BWY85_01965 [Firmicutes bacterium ADurb.Bin506]|nr:MAG: hypothetical protein BWY85_01965 [Firmicutes bacterium ADurb.Bin506]
MYGVSRTSRLDRYMIMNMAVVVNPGMPRNAADKVNTYLISRHDIWFW